MRKIGAILVLSFFVLTVIVSVVGAADDTTIKGTTADNTAASLNVTDSADASLLYIRNDGNVGISTTSPSELLALGTAGTTGGVISFAGATSGKAIIQPPAVAGTPTLTLPTSTGTLALTSDIGASKALDDLASVAINTSLLPGTSDGAALGSTTKMWSDLFLASGGVINWNNGNATLTHSTGLLTSNVPLSLGTANALTAGTIELGNASDTTISRASAGVAAVEGNNIYVAGGTDVAVADGGTGTSTGSITGTTALTFAAGGSNQNITLTPSGIGYVLLDSSAYVKSDGSNAAELKVGYTASSPAGYYAVYAP